MKSEFLSILTRIFVVYLKVLTLFDLQLIVCFFLQSIKSIVQHLFQVNIAITKALE